MSISATQVKELRELSGAGMMDCKAALEETNGDLNAAMDTLRKKGIAKADKKASRTAAEGLIGIAKVENKAVLVEINSETDFVARNESFQELVSNVSKVALKNDSSLDDLRQASYLDQEKSVTEAIKDASGTIGENLNLRRFASITNDKGVISTYIHNSIANNLGKLGVLVSIETDANKDKALEFGRQVAMHIAATNPLSLSELDIDSQIVEKEKEIFADQARQSGKPENIIEKMVEGRMRKFFEEVVLLSQSFVMNPDISVSQALKEFEKENNCTIKISKFVRFALGEGIEKEETDFASEVVAAAKG